MIEWYLVFLDFRGGVSGYAPGDVGQFGQLAAVPAGKADGRQPVSAGQGHRRDYIFGVTAGADPQQDDRFHTVGKCIQFLGISKLRIAVILPGAPQRMRFAENNYRQTDLKVIN